MKFIRKIIYRTILDESASTSVMSLSCWRAIGSPYINCSPTTLKAFNGHGLQPYGLISSLQVELEGKYFSIHIQVVDAPLHYNILLGRNWFYVMQVVASFVSQVVKFPFQWKIVMIE